MSDITFYDQNGNPTAYTEDEKHIYTFSGDPVAYIHNDSVYSYSGSHLGRFNKGWIRDNDGHCVFYTNNATGGPMKPMKSLKPLKSLKSLKPLKSLKEMRPMKPFNSNSWSSLSSTSFFEQ